MTLVSGVPWVGVRGSGSAGRAVCNERHVEAREQYGELNVEWAVSTKRSGMRWSSLETLRVGRNNTACLLARLSATCTHVLRGCKQACAVHCGSSNKRLGGFRRETRLVQLYQTTAFFFFFCCETRAVLRGTSTSGGAAGRACGLDAGTKGRSGR